MEKSKLLLKSFDFDNTHEESVITIACYPEGSDESAAQQFKGSVARYCPSTKTLTVHDNATGKSISVYTEDKYSLFQQMFEEAGKYDPNTDTYVVPKLSVFHDQLAEPKKEPNSSFVPTGDLVLDGIHALDDTYKSYASFGKMVAYFNKEASDAKVSRRRDIDVRTRIKSHLAKTGMTMEQANAGWQQISTESGEHVMRYIESFRQLGIPADTEEYVNGVYGILRYLRGLNYSAIRSCLTKAVELGLADEEDTEYFQYFVKCLDQYMKFKENELHDYAPDGMPVFDTILIEFSEEISRPKVTMLFLEGKISGYSDSEEDDKYLESIRKESNREYRLVLWDNCLHGVYTKGGTLTHDYTMRQANVTVRAGLDGVTTDYRGSAAILDIPNHWLSLYKEDQRVVKVYVPDDIFDGLRESLKDAFVTMRANQDGIPLKLVEK